MCFIVFCVTFAIETSSTPTVKLLMLSGCLLALPFFARAQIGIGNSNPAPSAALDIVSTARGLLIPRMTQAQRLAIISPATGLLVFQSDTNIGFFFFNGTTWSKFAVLGSPTSPSLNETIIYTVDGF